MFTNIVPISVESLLKQFRVLAFLLFFLGGDAFTSHVSSQSSPVIILPLQVVQDMQADFPFLNMDGVSILARNAGSVEIFGFPAMDSLRPLIEQCVMKHPVEPDEFLRFMLPGPAISGDTNRDTRIYYESIQLYLTSHPEVAWAAPPGMHYMLQDIKNFSNLIDIQVKSANYVGFVNPLERADAPRGGGE